MASVVFFRAVNVGAHQRFQPSALARQLVEFGVVNVGAAGTLVVRANVRATILKSLPFQPELMICPARAVLDLVRADPFRHHQAAVKKGARGFVSVLGKRPPSLPSFPIEQPAGARWQVRLLGVSGCFVLSLWQRHDRVLLYPNAVVEKQLGLPATTRNWDTFTTAAELLLKP
jgi:uncharacterized protein (DUF1697 family)